MKLSLEEFLQQEQGVGQQVSSGQFTIDFAVALEKMRQYQMADRSFYLLRLMQSAAVLGGRHLELKLGSDRVSFEFSVDEPGRYGELWRLLQGMSEFASGRSALDHLISGLQAALVTEPRSLQWRHLRGQKLEIADCSKDGVKLQRRFDGQGEARVSRFSFSLKGSSQGRGWARWLPFLRQRTHTHAVVCQRCLSLPTEIQLDGRPLERLGHKVRGWQVAQAAPRRSEELGFFANLKGDPVLLDQRGEPTRQSPSRFSLYATGSSGHSTVHWVRDGVVVSVENLSPAQIRIPFLAWIGADTLKTDISGFQVVHNKEREARLQQLYSILQQWAR